jgi:hypothetical protein
MRRIPAILLLLVFSLPLIGPAAWAQADPQVPECCRRLGLHHCVLRSAGSQPDAGAKWRPAAEKCPYFPALPTSPAGSKAALRSISRTLAAAPAVLLSRFDRGSVRYCLRLSDSHFKRGPPLA